jgi:hypothetical protein
MKKQEEERRRRRRRREKSVSHEQLHFRAWLEVK